MGKIFLFRHGQTLSNKQKKFCGITETPLISLEYKEFPVVDTLFCSTLSRCFYYAQFVDYKQIFTSSDLKEIDFGLWEGKTFYEIEKEDPILAKKYLLDYKDFCFPEGESFFTFRERINSFYRENIIPQIKNQKDILIISSEGVIKTLLILFLNINSSFFWNVKISNSSFCILEYFTLEEEINFYLTGLNLKTLS